MLCFFAKHKKDPRITEGLLLLCMRMREVQVTRLRYQLVPPPRSANRHDCSHVVFEAMCFFVEQVLSFTGHVKV